MKIIGKRGITLRHKILTDNIPFSVVYKLTFTACVNNFAIYDCEILNVSMCDFIHGRKPTLSRILNLSAASLLSKEKIDEFHRMSFAHANRWKKTLGALATHKISMSVFDFAAKRKFNNEVEKLNKNLQNYPEVIDAITTITDRYYSAQDRQILDWVREENIGNNQIREGLRNQFPNMPSALYFQEIFGYEVWKNNTCVPKDRRVEVISLGIDPYYFILYSDEVEINNKTRVMARVDDKFYNVPMYVSPNAPEEQLDIAVVLTITEALRKEQEKNSQKNLLKTHI